MMSHPAGVIGCGAEPSRRTTQARRQPSRSLNTTNASLSPIHSRPPCSWSTQAVSVSV